MPDVEQRQQRGPRSGERPLIRRDAEGSERTAPDWETVVERLIREGQEAGEFADLPGHGRRLDLTDDSAAGDMAMAYRILRNAGVAPPWIEADKEVRLDLGPETRASGHGRQ